MRVGVYTWQPWQTWHSFNKLEIYFHVDLTINIFRVCRDERRSMETENSGESEHDKIVGDNIQSIFYKCVAIVSCV